MTVEQLRKSGYKVRVIHQRFNDYHTLDMPELMSRFEASNYNIGWNPLPVGGKTIVEVTHPDGTFSTGVSLCSIQDNFNRKHGVKVALGRALSGKDVTVQGWTKSLFNME